MGSDDISLDSPSSPEMGKCVGFDDNSSLRTFVGPVLTAWLGDGAGVGLGCRLTSIGPRELGLTGLVLPFSEKVAPSSSRVEGLAGACWVLSLAEVAGIGFDPFSLGGVTGIGFVSPSFVVTEICLCSSSLGDLTYADDISPLPSTVGVGLNPSFPGGLGTTGSTSSSLEVVWDGLGADGVPPSVVEDGERRGEGVGVDKMGTGALVADDEGELNGLETAVVVRWSSGSGEVVKFDSFTRRVRFRSLTSARVISDDGFGDAVEAGPVFFGMTGSSTTCAVSSISSPLEAGGVDLPSRVSGRLVNVC